MFKIINNNNNNAQGNCSAGLIVDFEHAFPDWAVSY